MRQIVTTIALLFLLSQLAEAQSQTSIQQGTIVTDTPAIQTSATWNDGGVQFTHWNVDLTDTASDFSSFFFKFSLGGELKATLHKGGGLAARQLYQFYGPSNETRFYTFSTGDGAGWSNTDLGNDARGFQLQVGRNSNSSNPNPGSVQLVTAAGGAYSLWVSSAGNLHIGTSAPAGAVTDTSGTIVGTQSSSRDSKNILGKYTDYRGALDTILSTNLYSFTYKMSDYPTTFVGLVTDESPQFGQYPDESHPNGRTLNVVNSIGYLMGAVKAQQAEIDALRAEITRLKR